MGIVAKAKKLGHTPFVAGKGREKKAGAYTTYQCRKCWMLATRQGGEEFGPLIKHKCPKKSPLER